MHDTVSYDTTVLLYYSILRHQVYTIRGPADLQASHGTHKVSLLVLISNYITSL